jgi:hypothetical protein
MTNPITHSGWKAIANRLGVRDIDTAKRRVKKYSIPVIRLGRCPVLDEAVYHAWYTNFVAFSQKIGGGRNTPPDRRRIPPNTPQKQLSKRI